MKQKNTHRGFLIGRQGYGKHWVNMREGKTHWLIEHGSRYKKSNGWGVGDWPYYRLDLETIKKLES